MIVSPGQTFDLRHKVSSSLQLIPAKILPLRHEETVWSLHWSCHLRLRLLGVKMRLWFWMNPENSFFFKEHALSSVSVYSLFTFSNYSLLTCNTIWLFSRGGIWNVLHCLPFSVFLQTATLDIIHFHFQHLNDKRARQRDALCSREWFGDTTNAFEVALIECA